ncbi:MAG: hypothetical protein JOZ57_11600 [Abitibacteriaceae bacterium]|nr:hypothetical protein [Abditibacteriaceae bacterium]
MDTPTSIEDREVLDLLTSLIDKSLVVYEEDEQGAGRYRLLETVRQYACDRLVDARQSELVRRRHSDYFAAFAATAGPHLLGPEQKLWCDRLEAEHDNLRAALEWYLADVTDPEPQDASFVSAEAGLRLVSALQWFWWSRGYLREGYQQLRSALAYRDARGRTRSRASALTAAAMFATAIADIPTARASQTEGMAVAQEIGDNELLAASYFRLGMLAMSQADFAEARSYLEHGIELESRVADKTWQPHNRSVLGFCWMAQGDFGKARALFAEARRIAGSYGQVEGEVVALLGTGMTAYFEEAYDLARVSLEEGLAILRAGDYRTHQALALRFLGLAAAMQHNYGRANALLAQAVALNRESGETIEQARNLSALIVAAMRQEQYAEARSLLAECLPLLEELGMKFEMVLTLEAAAALHMVDQQWTRATCIYGAAAALRDRIGCLTIFKAQSDYEHQVNLCRAALEPVAFHAAWDDGLKMTIGRAVGYALNRDSAQS